jgi:hypothetical protein
MSILTDNNEVFWPGPKGLVVISADGNRHPVTLRPEDYVETAMYKPRTDMNTVEIARESYRIMDEMFRGKWSSFVGFGRREDSTPGKGVSLPPRHPPLPSACLDLPDAACYMKGR